MQTWDWQTWRGYSYLTCSLLKDWAHGFFTQQFWSRSPAELATILHPETLHPKTKTYRVKQVHGDTVLNASELEPTQPQLTSEVDRSEADSLALSEADGLYTTAAHQAVWVCTADCTPVLIGDMTTGQVAAVHAGWRGTAARIVPKTIARLQAHGSQIADLRIAMGPAIAGEVYQVSTTVAAQVGATVLDDMHHPDHAPANLEDRKDAVEAILQQLHQLPDSPVMEDPQPGRARLDVRRVNQLQLQQLGIEPDQISIAPFCTYQHPDLFFSYRRAHQKKVQWSGIVSQA